MIYKNSVLATTFVDYVTVWTTAICQEIQVNCEGSISIFTIYIFYFLFNSNNSSNMTLLIMKAFRTGFSFIQLLHLDFSYLKVLASLLKENRNVSFTSVTCFVNKLSQLSFLQAPISTFLFQKIGKNSLGKLFLHKRRPDLIPRSNKIPNREALTSGLLFVRRQWDVPMSSCSI